MGLFETRRKRRQRCVQPGAFEARLGPRDILEKSHTARQCWCAVGPTGTQVGDTFHARCGCKLQGCCVVRALLAVVRTRCALERPNSTRRSRRPVGALVPRDRTAIVKRHAANSGGCVRRAGDASHHVGHHPKILSNPARGKANSGDGCQYRYCCGFYC